MKVIETVEQSQLLYDEANRILKLQFIGNMSDDAYMDFWTKSIDFGEKQQINRIVIDQQQVGNISFSARGWVVIKAFPRIKKVLPRNLVAAVLSSEKLVQKSSMQYLLKAFRTLTGYEVEVFSSQEEAVSFLKAANNHVLQ